MDRDGDIGDRSNSDDGAEDLQNQGNWINYRTTCETRRKEKHFYDAGLDAHASAGDREATFVERVEALISRENTLWLTTHRPRTQTDSDLASRG